MRLRRFASLALVLWGLSYLQQLPVPLLAATGFVQVKSGSNGNDLTITLDNPPASGNCVVVWGMVNSETGPPTFDITGTPAAETEIHAETISGASFTLTIWAATWIGDGADASFVIDTTANTSTRGYALELSGSNCTEDGTSEVKSSTATTSYALTTGVTVATGSTVACYIQSNTVADFTHAGSWTAIGSGGSGDDTDIGTVALGAYQVGVSAGTYGASGNIWTSAANENALMGCVGIAESVAAAGGSFRRLLMGVGE